MYGSHQGSALIRFGHSSDKKAHLRQAKLGQAVSEDGVALYHRTDNGARNETAVVCQALEDLRAALGGPGFLLCGDTALVSEGNLRALVADQISFLAPLSACWGASGRYLKELSPERLEPIDYVSERQRKLPAEQRTRYRGAELPWPLELDDGTHAQLRALFVHSSEEEAAIRKSCARSLERAEEQLERVKRGLGGRHYPDHRAVECKLVQILQGTPGRFIAAETGARSDGKPTLSFEPDQDAIAEAERVDGIYCLITSLPAEQADHTALLADFKEQERVERGHRTLKGPLRVRPLFVQNDDRIIALLAVCCFALMIYTLVERDARRLYPDGLCARSAEDPARSPSRRSNSRSHTSQCSLDCGSHDRWPSRGTGPCTSRRTGTSPPPRGAGLPSALQRASALGPLSAAVEAATMMAYERSKPSRSALTKSIPSANRSNSSCSSSASSSRNEKQHSDALLQRQRVALSNPRIVHLEHVQPSAPHPGPLKPTEPVEQTPEPVADRISAVEGDDQTGGIPASHSRSIVRSVLDVASRVRSSAPTQRTSLSSPGPSIEMPTLTL